jgi:hypothetical protein
MATIRLGDYTSITTSGEVIVVTRPTIMGGVATHIIDSEYGPEEIAFWLEARMTRRYSSLLAQEAFPNMKPEDREFLMSGITPEAWNKMFPKEED